MLRLLPTALAVALPGKWLPRVVKWILMMLGAIAGESGVQQGMPENGGRSEAGLYCGRCFLHDPLSRRQFSITVVPWRVDGEPGRSP